ncbi:hypothetical protein MKQ70_29575 [Chitinophaga sedimenti]|uniref:hypothetical protein n=1 Tax=Chitinophaga sedimenti TaxID=2033606 RepID=UPI002006CC61|nr:hypothetical protein [Chitinophaga sedimenti]MCK7558907.1 hypothetical protein [Chitinophaga sedimenti]
MNLIYNSRSGVEPISFEQFDQKYLKAGDVDKLVVVNKRYVEVYIKKDKLKDPKFDKVNKNRFGSENPGPHFTISIGSIEDFNKKMDRAQEALPPGTAPVDIFMMTKRTGSISLPPCYCRLSSSLVCGYC